VTTRTISVKALAIGVAANIVLTIVTTMVVTIVSLLVEVATTGAVSKSPSDTELAWFSVVMLTFPGAAAGYIAACAAPSRPLLHGALSVLLVPLFVLYMCLGGPLPDMPHHDHGDFLWFFYSDYTLAVVPLLCGLAGAYVRSLVAPRTLGRWTGSVLAMVAVYLIVAGPCFLVTHAAFSYSLAAMAAVIVGHFAAPPQHRCLALFVLAVLLAAMFALECAGFAISGSPRASASLVVTANVALGCGIAVITMRRHYARGSGGGAPSAG
jgi:hypothetical protein